jgi:hypothetical protein
VFALIASFVSPTILTKAVDNTDYRDRYCYDTAANRHVFNSYSNFNEYRAASMKDIRGSTGSTTALGVGTVKLEVVKTGGTTEKIFLKDVLHCPDFATNVIF